MTTGTRPGRHSLKERADDYLLAAARDLGDAEELARYHLKLTADGVANAVTERGFVHAMVVRYISPWSETVNEATAKVYALVDVLEGEERKLHDRLLYLRHNDVAHTNRKHTDPAIHAEDGGLSMFSRRRYALPHADVLGLWHNAHKLAGTAVRILAERYPEVSTMGSHEAVTVLEPVTSHGRAVEIAAGLGQAIHDLIEREWRDCDLVTLEQAAERLRFAPDTLARFAHEAARQQDGFPAPFPLDYPDHPGPLWRMSWIRRWAAPPLVRMGT